MKKMGKHLAATVMLLVSIAAAVRGQTALDGFDPNANNAVLAVVLQRDGKILIGGQFTTLAPNGGAAVTRNRIARLNPDGTVDSTFDPNANGNVNAIAVQTDGKILAGGTFTNIGGQTRNRIARLDPTTGLADSFDPNANAIVRAIAVQADSKILVGGNFTGANIGGQPRSFIARLDPTTGLADSFNPNPNNFVDSVAVQADGKILVGGGFGQIGGQTRRAIARLDATTGLADAFDPNANGRVNVIVVQADGKILVGGAFSTLAPNGGATITRNRIARVNADGTVDNAFDPNAINTQVESIALQADGKILVGGQFTAIGGAPRKDIARLEASTGLADSFDPNVTDLGGPDVNAIAVQPDGKILIGGYFTTLAPNGGATVTRNRIARLFLTAPTPTPTATPTLPVITSPLVATGTVGLPFTYQLVATGATSLGVNNLPSGLTFNTSLGAITGLPTTTGSFPVGLSATNSNGTTNATLTLTVQPAPTSGPVVVSSTAVTGRVGQPFRFQVYSTGGTPAARVSASGLPAGLSIDAVSGRISGTPAFEGSSAVNLTVTDGAFVTTSTVQLTFTADPALPVITSPGSGALTTGEFFTYTIVAPSSADPSTDPTIFTVIGTLPQGLTFDGVDTISGIYTGPLLRKRANGRALQPELAGGTLGSIQLFGTNSHGTSTFQLLFLAAPAGVVNISTRLQIGTSENVLIGGFIVTGNAPKVVIVRALGPSIGVPGALQDPTLELHNSVGAPPVLNDNWRDTQQQIIFDSGIPPPDDRESAIVIALDPGPYTAIVAGKNGATGIGLVEVYDLGTASLDSSGDAKLAQISTRGKVLTGDDLMIGGFIVASRATRVIVRAIGPSLNGAVTGALQDTALELHDGSGSLIASNDDWRSDQEAEIIATGVPPSDNHESAIVANLNPGGYTAIVRGTNNTTGVALVEVYSLLP